MRKIYLLTVVLLLAQMAVSQDKIWTTGTAITLSPKNYSFGIFQPLRYGLKNNLEVFTYPLAFPAIPNVGVKKMWYKTKNDWYFGSRHAIHYPSLFLKVSSGEGIGRVMPPDAKVPQIISLTNELLVSTWLIKETSCTPPNLLLTLKAGAKNGLKFGESNFPTIDYPGIYYQTIPYQKKHFLWYLGADLDGNLTESVNFCIDLDWIAVNWNVEDFAIEHKGMLLIPFAKRTTFIVGYKISYGTYPFGNKFMIMPLIDLQWNIQPKRKIEKGLFDPQMSK